jgi:hypothetical protein
MSIEVIHPSEEPGETVSEFDRRLFWRALIGALAVLTVGGAYLWLRFGSLIFFDMLSALQGCF